MTSWRKRKERIRWRICGMLNELSCWVNPDGHYWEEVGDSKVMVCRHCQDVDTSRFERV